MTIHIVNPLADHRWDDLVERHPRASVFHQRSWLEALSRTYGYEPLVLTSTPPGQKLEDGFVFCRVASWITGTRLVSLPFADHCEPLVSDLAQSTEFLSWLREKCDRGRWRYVELRPLFSVPVAGSGLQPSQSFSFHELDIRPSLEQIFRRLHKDSIQRRIRRAEKERFTYEAGASAHLVEEFYRLVLTTRRRQKLPPQPRSWFDSLVECMGDRLQIRLVRKDETPMAAILSLRHRSTMVYKYGCSDEKFHHFGVMPFLFWRLIEESKALGIERIDFGRSDLDRPSLSAFKDKFGTTKRLLTYYRYNGVSRKQGAGAAWTAQVMRQVFSVLPDAVLSKGGRLLYRHMG